MLSSYVKKNFIPKISMIKRIQERERVREVLRNRARKK